jgi:hypothetical protein
VKIICFDFYFLLKDEFTATGEHTWMLTSKFRALRAKFREVFVALNKKSPDMQVV